MANATPQTFKIDDSIVLTIAQVGEDTMYGLPIIQLDVAIEREGLKVTFGNSVSAEECEQLVAALTSAMTEAQRRWDAQ